MLDKLLSFIAPHHCCGCDKIGSILCGNCKYYITSEENIVCIVCGRPTLRNWLCNTCRVPYQQVWVVGERTGILQRLIGLYKFERAKSAYKALGDLLLDVLPDLPSDTVIIPIPTVTGHVRERGYDHMLLIARYITRRRNLKFKQLLLRATNTKQRQSSAEKRDIQAKQAFVLNGKIDVNTPYLLIDDVFTTGSTIKYASKILRDAGAKHVWVAIIARQTLD
jgi:competence protein ComFC